MDAPCFPKITHVSVSLLLPSMCLKVTAIEKRDLRGFFEKHKQNTGA